ncbi:MAG: acyltransferase [Bacteroidota bacterium]
MKKTGPRPVYFPQLDGLRAIAILAVIFEHWIPEFFSAGFSIPLPFKIVGGESRLNFLFSKTTLFAGVFGVHLFFVLSGFLIGNILIRQREAIEQGIGTYWQAIRNFYARRTIRIFPIYYLVVFILIVTNWAGFMRDIAPWLLTYTFNVKIYLASYFYPPITHLWTLACEEQFYLLLPPILLLSPLRRIPVTIACFIVFSWLFRFLIQAFGPGNPTLVFFLGPAVFDKFSLGLLLAWFGFIGKKIPYRIPAMFAGFALFFICGFIENVIPGRTFIQLSAVSIAFACLTDLCAEGFKGFTGRVLTSKPMVWIGRVSYGLYLYHCFVPPLVLRFFWFTGLHVPGTIVKTGVDTLVLLLVTYLSFWYIETPVNRLKSAFAYKG